MLGNHPRMLEIMPQKLWSSFLFLGSGISVIARTRESGGSKKTICWFAIFSELIIVPPNLTESGSVNIDGANLRLITFLTRLIT